MAKIGGRLKILRQRRQLSIRLLSLRSGVSHSTISLIERDRVSPSLDTLSAILEAMGSTLIGFLSDEPQGAINPFYRLADQPEIGNENGISYRIIGLNHPNRRFQFLKETYQMDAGSGTGLRHEAQEAGLVLSGHIEVTGGEGVAVLGPGDGYYFDSREGHSFRNVGQTTAEIVSAITPPSY